MFYTFEVGALLHKIEKVISSTNDEGVEPKKVLEMYKSVLSKLQPPPEIRETGRHGYEIWKTEAHSYVSRVVCEEYGLDDIEDYIVINFYDEGLDCRVPDVINLSCVEKPVDKLKGFVETYLLSVLQGDTKVLLSEDEVRFLVKNGVDLGSPTVKI